MMNSFRKRLGLENFTAPMRRTRKSEILAWMVVAFQLYVMLSKSPPSEIHDNFQFSAASDGKDKSLSLDMNTRPLEYYEQRRRMSRVPFFESPQVHSKEAGLVSRVWRSNGSPSIHSELQTGSCWCSADEWCMCTPSLAVDVILRSGNDHIWCVKRQDTGLLALMGGFTEVGETSEESVHRELKEEMGITLKREPKLFGVYNDPLRDARRHTTSVVYIADVPGGAEPRAGDDATSVIRLPLAQVENSEFFIDHKTIIRDYMTMVERAKGGEERTLPAEPRSGDAEPFKRSVCRPF